MFEGNNREAYLLSIFHQPGAWPYTYIYIVLATSSVLALLVPCWWHSHPHISLNDIDVFLFNPKTDFLGNQIGAFLVAFSISFGAWGLPFSAAENISWNISRLLVQSPLWLAVSHIWLLQNSATIFWWWKTHRLGWLTSDKPWHFREFSRSWSYRRTPRHVLWHCSAFPWRFELSFWGWRRDINIWHHPANKK